MGVHTYPKGISPKVNLKGIRKIKDIYIYIYIKREREKEMGQE